MAERTPKRCRKGETKASSAVELLYQPEENGDGTIIRVTSKMNADKAASASKFDLQELAGKLKLPESSVNEIARQIMKSGTYVKARKFAEEFPTFPVIDQKLNDSIRELIKGREDKYTLAAFDEDRVKVVPDSATALSMEKTILEHLGIKDPVVEPEKKSDSATKSMEEVALNLDTTEGIWKSVSIAFAGRFNEKTMTEKYDVTRALHGLLTIMRPGCTVNPTKLNELIVKFKDASITSIEMALCQRTWENNTSNPLYVFKARCTRYFVNSTRGEFLIQEIKTNSAKKSSGFDHFKHTDQSHIPPAKADLKQSIVGMFTEHNERGSQSSQFGNAVVSAAHCKSVGLVCQLFYEIKGVIDEVCTAQEYKVISEDPQFTTREPRAEAPTYVREIFIVAGNIIDRLSCLPGISIESRLTLQLLLFTRRTLPLRKTIQTTVLGHIMKKVPVKNAERVKSESAAPEYEPGHLKTCSALATEIANDVVYTIARAACLVDSINDYLKKFRIPVGIIVGSDPTTKPQDETFEVLPFRTGENTESADKDSFDGSEPTGRQPITTVVDDSQSEDADE